MSHYHFLNFARVESIEIFVAPRISSLCVEDAAFDDSVFTDKSISAGYVDVPSALTKHLIKHNWLYRTFSKSTLLFLFFFFIQILSEEWEGHNQGLITGIC